MKNIMELKEVASSFSLLYVEDDKELAQTFITYLSKIFNEVVYAQNGEQGLELYKDNNFELVITDIRMPKMDGIEMSKEIKKINPNQNIIISSAYSDTEYFVESIKIGVDAYIIKPVNYTNLNNTLFKIVTKIKMEKESGSNSKELAQIVSQLAKKNNELSQFLDILNQVAIVSKTNLKGHITYVNNFFCEISGYSQEELLGANHNIVRHPDMPKNVYKDMWDTIQAGETWKGSIKNKTKSGDTYFVFATIIPIYADNNTIKEYMGIRFLTTKEENEKRDFQKSVISRYQEFQKKNYNATKEIEQLETELSQISDEDQHLKIFIQELRDKNKKLLGQINFCENEFSKNNKQHNKIIDTASENLKIITQDYKKLLTSYELQKEEIEFLQKDDKLRKEEIVKLQTVLNEQSEIVRELRDTIKHISEDDPKESDQKKHFWE